MTATAYATNSKSYIHISKLHLKYVGSCSFPDFDTYSVVAGVDRAQAQVGDNLKVTLSFNRQDNTDSSITYLVRFTILTYHTHLLSQVAQRGRLNKVSPSKCCIENVSNC